MSQLKTPRRWWLLALALFFLPSCQPGTPSSALPDHPQIIWDEWGVPHIYADTLEGVSYGFGWAQARNHGPLLIRILGESRGKGAEYWGPELVNQDSWIHRMGIPERAEKWYAEQEPEARRALDAFVAGVNQYLERHSEEVPADSRPVLPILASDVLAHVNRVIHFRFLSNPEGVQRLVSAPSNRAGSNAWAVAPTSTRNNAMLLINPHLPWSGFYTWMEGQLVTEGMNIYGAALLGMPFMALGFNQQLGWTHTVNTIDAADIYQLELQGDGYLWNGQVRPFEVRRQLLQVRQPDGSFSQVELELKSSVHGPVFESGDKALALRVAGLDRAQMFQQYLDMARSRNLTQFEEAVARLQIPMFTLIYADQTGHILSLFGGVVPRRPSGQWNWSGVVPGTSSETLWEETHVYGELPRVLDPPAGWVQNANEPPWTTTLPYVLKAADFPSYMAPRGMPFRPQSSVRLLTEQPATLEDLMVQANSTRLELAERVLDDLLPILAEGPDPVRKAGEVLKAWDRTADAASRGGVLFEDFWLNLERRMRALNSSPFQVAWDEQRPNQTPDGLREPDLVRQVMAEAVASIEKTHGAIDVPWGDVYRLRRGGLDFPASGGPGGLGIFRVVGYGPPEGGRRPSEFGDSFVAVAEFLEQGTRAFVITTYGNSSNPDSIHYGDQLELFAQKRMRPALLTRAEAEAHKSQIEDLPYSGS